MEDEVEALALSAIVIATHLKKTRRKIYHNMFEGFVFLTTFSKIVK